MPEFPAHSSGDPVGCHKYWVMGVQTQLYKRVGNLSKALAVSLMMLDE